MLAQAQGCRRGCDPVNLLHMANVNGRSRVMNAESWSQLAAQGCHAQILPAIYDPASIPALF